MGDKEVRVHPITFGTGGEVTLDFQHPDGIVGNGHPIALRLYDSENNEIASLTARGNAKLYATVPAGGTYYLSARDADFSSKAPGAYSFTSTLKNDLNTIYDGGANNSLSTALHLPVDHVVRGRLEYRDTDTFYVEPDAGGRLRFQFAHANGQGAEGNMVRLHVTDMQSKVILTGTMRGDHVFETTVPMAGRYLVTVSQVFSEQPNKGLYTLAPVFDTYKGVVYDSPANDAPSEAQLLPLGRTAIGRAGANDIDYYKFDASSGGKLSLNFGHPYGPGKEGGQMTIEIADSKGKVLLAKAERGSDLLNVDLENGGSYTVKISNPFYKEVPGYYSIMAGLANNDGKTIVLANAGAFVGSSGNDVVHGSTGTDIMSINGNAGDHTIVVYPAGATVFDTAGRHGRDTLFNVERLKFDDKMVAIDVSGVAGQAFRLYEAAFNRASDDAGLGFWIHHLDNGLPLHHVAQEFITSAEFIGKYGANLSNAAFVTKLYENVLDRAPDAAGIDYWVTLLGKGTVDRADVLIGMANSDENVAKLVGATMDGIEYLAWGS
ncbi:DUF4214 domain-containing protein [Massilia consociata]|uniref:DUF4214 domain-containing protein n=1 Tax=Massilia consociata TaxID=760117 RepID=A0ABV6FJT4_9BURK